MELPRTITQFSARTIDLEPDTIAICEPYPEYFVIGTYSLIEDGSNDAIKKGSIEVHRFDTTVQSETDGNCRNIEAQECSPFGIYDIHFHPEEKTLLGVATSNSEILFYRFTVPSSTSGATRTVKLTPLGKVIAEPVRDGNVAIITQFQFLSIQGPETEAMNSDYGKDVFLAATTQFGNTKLFRVCIHNSPEDAIDIKAYDNFPTLESVSVDVHKQSMGLEAWTVCPIEVGNGRILFVSGGDDSQMIGSLCDVGLSGPYFPSPATQVFADKRSHEAGVVSLLSLGQGRLDEVNNSFLLLSGSYDEHLRLFMLDVNTLKPVLKSDLKLPGGVWRIYLLDKYMTSTGMDYVLLIAAHLGGAFIVRLSEKNQQDAATSAVWDFVVEAEFTTGHKSLVYACAAVCDEVRGQKRKWSVISTSFYDKQVCTWEWIDDKPQPQV